ncbi:YhdT family protein [Ureibacillus sp. FSL W8-0352]|uniref:YhdT family protein n=1 Tax=Ureibacillus sp. FSL W8-0352 TaxID=2954596 RepID=UPI0040489EF9
MEDKMFSKDPRFKVAKREAWIGVGLVVINFLWWFGFAYGLSKGSPTEYTYILGFPAWFFYSCIGGLIIMSILITFVVKVFLKKSPLMKRFNQMKKQIKGDYDEFGDFATVIIFSFYHILCWNVDE